MLGLPYHLAAVFHVNIRAVGSVHVVSLFRAYGMACLSCDDFACLELLLEGGIQTSSLRSRTDKRRSIPRDFTSSISKLPCFNSQGVLLKKFLQSSGFPRT